ncbi:flavin reductase family protein [Verticiella sediminum]|uniref:Flavin reductase family protein n=1 Tax=Verticiella sediminum TaxID=1247510 RepID=A0A556ALQ0_9BURK|nr:flavin reductase family protein [Verticiella sediminum]TSH93819.1 flavin reductase family protein [Verticiella sediminum]
MFLDPLHTPGFKRTLFNAIVAPRPIGWISTLDAEGRANLAPFSQFNLVSTAPPVVMFSCNTPDDRPEKDTLANARRNGEFVANLATWELREAVNLSSTPCPPGEDEFVLAGLAKADAVYVRAPRVAASPASLECRVMRIIELPAEHPGETVSHVVFGRVVGVHLDDAHVTPEGRFDTARARPLTRLGGLQYATPGEIFELPSHFARAR